MADQNQNPNRNAAEGARNQNAGGADLAEGAAWAGGGAAGMALGSMLGPVGAVAGAVAGGAMADEAVENAQGRQAQRQGGGGAEGQAGQQ